MLDDQIKDEKLQYDMNREAAKLSALPPGKINKYILQANKFYLLIKNK